METEIIVKFLKEIAPSFGDLTIDAIIETQKAFPEVVEVLQQEKRRRQRAILIDMIRNAATGTVIGICNGNFIKIHPVEPDEIKITQDDILRYKLKYDLSDLQKEFDKLGAMANDLKFSEVNVVNVKPSVNPFDRQYKRHRR